MTKVVLPVPDIPMTIMQKLLLVLIDDIIMMIFEVNTKYRSRINYECQDIAMVNKTYHFTVKKHSSLLELLLIRISLPIISIQLGSSWHLYFCRKRGAPFTRLVWSKKLKDPSRASVMRRF